MKLSAKVECYFEAWAGVETWHTLHFHDRDRFYRFVKAVLRYSRRPMTGEDLRLLLIEKFDGKLRRDYLEEQAGRYAREFDAIYAFSKCRLDFPSVLIEKNNISRFWHEVIHRTGDDDAETDEWMTRVWGKEWKDRMEAESGYRPR